MTWTESKHTLFGLFLLEAVEACRGPLGDEHDKGYLVRDDMLLDPDLVAEILEIFLNTSENLQERLWLGIKTDVIRHDLIENYPVRPVRGYSPRISVFDGTSISLRDFKSYDPLT